MTILVTSSQTTLNHSERHRERNGAAFSLECSPGDFQTALKLYRKAKPTVQAKRVMVIDGMFDVRNVLYLLQKRCNVSGQCEAARARLETLFRTGLVRVLAFNPDP